MVLSDEEDGDGGGGVDDAEGEGEGVGDGGGDAVPSTWGIASSSPIEDSNLLFFWARVVIRAAEVAEGMLARVVGPGLRGVEVPGLVWVPRVEDARAGSESAVGTGVEDSTEEGFARGAAARSAARALLAILLFLLC